MSEYVFWLSAAAIVYAYVGYPLVLLVLSRARYLIVHEAEYLPKVSIIVAVHNEEDNIERKLENLLSLDYPQDKLEIVIVSDHSQDATEQIVSRFEDRGVVLITLPERKGKHYAQKSGIDRATGEILAFTDAAPVIGFAALKLMMRYFGDPAVGCVSSEDRVLEESARSGEEHNYIQYLMQIRRLETAQGSVVGLSGSFFAARRELCTRWRTDRSSDFFLALEAVRRGYRAVHHPDSLHYYRAARSLAAEFWRKERTILNGLVVFFDSLDMLNPFHYGLYSFQLVSHKLLRWLVPFLLLACLTSNILLAFRSTFYLAALLIQTVCYLAAMLALASPSVSRIGPFRLAGFFLLSNAAVVLAWIELLRGQTREVWTPTRRP